MNEKYFGIGINLLGRAVVRQNYRGALEMSNRLHEVMFGEYKMYLEREDLIDAEKMRKEKLRKRLVRIEEVIYGLQNLSDDARKLIGEKK